MAFLKCWFSVCKRCRIYSTKIGCLNKTWSNSNVINYFSRYFISSLFKFNSNIGCNTWQISWFYLCLFKTMNYIICGIRWKQMQKGNIFMDSNYVGNITKWRKFLLNIPIKISAHWFLLILRYLLLVIAIWRNKSFETIFLPRLKPHW